jgi:hypothetical protein
MFSENDNDGVVIENDEQADAQLDIPNVDFKEGEENVQLPAATVKKLIETSRTALAQKKHWRGKALDPTTGKPYKDLIPANDKGNNGNGSGDQGKMDALAGDVATLKQSEEKRLFGYEHKLSPEETDRVFAYANGVGKKPAEVLPDPFVKNALDGMRSAARREGATPGSSSRSPVVDGKNFNEMNTDDKRKNFGAVVAALGKK